MSTTRTVTRLTARQVRVGTAVVSASCAAVVASTVKAREATEALTPGLVEDLASNPALRALYGTPFDLATPGGFTVWRLGMFLAATTGLWGLLTATRLLRGEEDAGRAELVLTAPISRRRLTDVTMLVVAVAAPIIGAAVALGFIATSQAVSSSALFGAGIALLTLDFIAVGGLTSQLFGTRRRASGAAGLALGATFLLRMVADGSSGLGWLRWFTPFGWLEELRPFADERAFPLALLAALAVGLGGLALALSRQRDLGDGIVRERDTAELRPRLLHSPLGFQWRQGLGGLVGWGLALVATGLVIGGITSVFTAYVAENPDVQDFVGRFGFGDLGTVAGFVGSMDVFAAMAVALFVVTATNRVWEDEQERRLELAYPTPVTRPEWLGASVVSTVSAALIVSAGCAAGDVDRGAGGERRSRSRRCRARTGQHAARGRRLPRHRGAPAGREAGSHQARCRWIRDRGPLHQRVRPDREAAGVGPRPLAVPSPRAGSRCASGMGSDDRAARARRRAVARRLRRVPPARPARLVAV